MAVDAEDWCHAVFLHPPKVRGPAGAQSCWDPSGQSLGASAPPRGCCTQSISTEFPQHITPYIEVCHWCPLNLSITYRIALLTFKATHQFSPAYLMDLLSICLVIPWGPTLLVSCQILHLKWEPLTLFSPFQHLCSSDMEAVAGKGSRMRWLFPARFTNTR